MINVVGVRYKRAGRVYYFNPNGLELSIGDNVVVDTARGSVLAIVAQNPKEVTDEEVVKPLKTIIRLANFEDIKASEGLKEKEDKALFETASIVKRLNLPMNLIAAEYNLDLSRLTIYFGAEGRVDFRELVKELNRTLRTLVELRQIGPRDEAKLIGGYGRCGRQLCCEGFLSDFNPVSIKMAKEQNLPLNSTKISGVCGRLLCCLDYEYEQYKAQNRRMPKRGSVVQTPNGEAIVVSSKPMEELVTVKTETEAIIEYPLAALKMEGVFLVENDSDADKEDGVSDEDILHDEIPAYPQNKYTDNKNNTINSGKLSNKPYQKDSKNRQVTPEATVASSEDTDKHVRGADNIEERKNRNYKRHGHDNKQGLINKPQQEPAKPHKSNNDATGFLPGRRKFVPRHNKNAGGNNLAQG
ncbi:MAG: stage 0 sporulation family protein [Chloroflexi bacterium]|nr:stage 0 sporulation family protein [Chloroflexota bacterium]